MAALEPTLEIERIKNLIVNFSWNVTKQKITDDEITLTITKEISLKPSELDVGAS